MSEKGGGGDERVEEGGGNRLVRGGVQASEAAGDILGATNNKGDLSIAAAAAATAATAYNCLYILIECRTRVSGRAERISLGVVGQLENQGAHLPRCCVLLWTS